MSRILARGTTAPEFTLRVTQDQYLSLADLKGRRVINKIRYDGPDDFEPMIATISAQLEYVLSPA